MGLWILLAEAVKIFSLHLLHAYGIIPEQRILPQPSPCETQTVHVSCPRELSGFRAHSHASEAAVLAHAAPLQGLKAGGSACTGTS